MRCLTLSRKGCYGGPFHVLDRGLIMVFRNKLLAVVGGIVLLASPQFGFAQTTTIEVPQGTGVFPTIGQIKCLEELGSGRFCAATYENYCRYRRDGSSSTDSSCDDGAPLAWYLIDSAGGIRTYTAREALSYSGNPYNYSGFNVESGFPCRDFAEEHLATLGIEVRYCDQCDNPNEYRLAIAPSE